MDKGLAEYVSVCTKEPNKRSDGSNRISVVQALSNERDAEQELRQLLAESFGPERADAETARQRRGMQQDAS